MGRKRQPPLGRQMGKEESKRRRTEIMWFQQECRGIFFTALLRMPRITGLKPCVPVGWKHQKQTFWVMVA